MGSRANPGGWAADLALDEARRQLTAKGIKTNDGSVAWILGVNRNTVVRWRHGHRLNGATAARVAARLGVALESLRFIDTEDQPA